MNIFINENRKFVQTIVFDMQGALKYRYLRYLVLAIFFKRHFLFCLFQIARWSKLWKLIQDGECDTCADFVVDSDLDLDPNSTFDLKVKRFLMDRSILKVHLPNGGFNMVKYGDATDVKVSAFTLKPDYYTLTHKAPKRQTTKFTSAK